MSVRQSGLTFIHRGDTRGGSTIPPALPRGHNPGKHRGACHYLPSTEGNTVLLSLQYILVVELLFVSVFALMWLLLTKPPRH